jgi:hypothetical protein
VIDRLENKGSNIREPIEMLEQMKRLRVESNKRYEENIDFSTKKQFVIDSSYVVCAKVIERGMENWKMNKQKKQLKEAIKRNMTVSKETL